MADARDEVGPQAIDLNALRFGVPPNQSDTVLGAAVLRATAERDEPGTVIGGFDNNLSEP